ncbi:efflux RND transporter periplasmic adaptor subunit [Pectobacterium cacticida]|uniref:efflux RND transporter periplasmic adaptor subunit n=1 Tax=Pectobacterium cacticida TaxID=69221 RepID=UPI00398899BC
MKQEYSGFRKRILVVSVVAALLSACDNKDEATEQEVADTPVVQVATVVAQPVSFTSSLPGRVEPIRIAEVRARVPGIVLMRKFVEGADVKAGDILFQIDPAPFKAALARAQGDLARAEAAVAEMESVVKRYKPLVAIDAVSHQDYDTAQAALKSAQAQRQSAVATVETARLDLSYATVRAPISGRIGRALVTEGALVGQGEATPLAVIQQLVPAYVDFKQPLADFMRLRQHNAQGTALIRVSIEGVSQPSEGHLLFTDVTVDRGTGQISLRGEFPNEDSLLLPGMYVRVHVEHARDELAILVPQRAIRPTGEGTGIVMVLDENDVAQEREVRLGVMQNSRWQVVEGLESGERIVTDGVVAPDMKVQVVANVAQPAESTPPTGSGANHN